jgi:two-component system chemotaxis response regulator CheY
MPEALLAGRRFLLVEDDPFTRKIMERILRQAGASAVFLAADGTEAVSRVNKLGVGIDCIISDLHMKPMHGLFLLQAVRSGVVPLPRDTPMVIVTANANDHLLRYAIELDCNGFMSKPVSFASLQSRVRRAFDEQFDLKEPPKYAGIKLPPKILQGEYVKINGIDYPVYGKPTPRTEGQKGTNVRKTQLSELAPGGTVVHEVRSANGMLLLAPGVELTSLIINRLKDIAEMDQDIDTIWVDDP